MSASSIDQMWYPYTRLDDDSNESVGLSWFIEPYDQDTKRFIYHEGGDIGFLTNLALLPEESLAIILLSNSALTPTWDITDLILAGVRGTDTEIPKPPALIPLSRTLVEKGLDAAVEHARTLSQSHVDHYNFDLDYFFFPAHHCLTILKQMEIAIQILHMCVAIHPESAQAHQHLAWAYMKCGDRTQALSHVQQALALDPENEEAANLCKQLQGER